jgi:hypothetical protein
MGVGVGVVSDFERAASKATAEVVEFALFLLGNDASQI